MRSTEYRLSSTVLIACLLSCGGAAFAAELDGGSTCSFQNQQVTLPITFTNDGSITGLQFDVAFDATVVEPVAVAFTAATDHVLDWQVATPGVLRVLLYTRTNALVPDGDVVELILDVSADATGASVPLPIVSSFATLGASRAEPGTAPEPGDVELVTIGGPIADVGCNGRAATLDSDVAGPGPHAYQWLKDGQPIGGATSATFDISVVDFSRSGLYQVQVQNGCGTGTSEFALVDVLGVCQVESLGVYDPGTGGSLELVWNPNPSVDVDAYRLAWSTQPGGPYLLQQDVPVRANATVEGLTNGTRYYFRINALIGVQESPFNDDEASATATAAGLALPQAPDYGYQTSPSNDTTHADVVTYRFPSHRGDATLWYDVYDVDQEGEVSIKLNGVEVFTPEPTGNSSWAGLRTVLLPDALVWHDRDNVLTFDNTDTPPGTETWGARLVSLKLAAPALVARSRNLTVDLQMAPPAHEPSLAGFDVFRSTFESFVPTIANRIAEAVPGTSYRDDDGLTNGETYYYIARPVDTIANPGFASVTAAAMPTSADVTPVIDLVVGREGTDDVRLSWSAVMTSAGVQGYRLYEGAAPDALGFTGLEAPSTESTQPGDYTDGAVHYYWIEVVDTDGNTSTE